MREIGRNNICEADVQNAWAEAFEKAPYLRTSGIRLYDDITMSRVAKVISV